MESGLSKIKNFEGILYRGVDMPASWMKDVKAKFQHRTPGERLRVPFCDAAFLSASTMLRTSFGGKTCRFVIHSKTGKDIATYSVHPNEHEVLFAPSTKFTIYNVIPLENGNLFIRMRED